MKKKLALCLILVVSVASVVLLPGCTNIGTTSQWKETRSLRESYEVTASRARGDGSCHEISLIIFPIYVWGDNSFETAKLKAIQSVPGSDDLINISADYEIFDAIFYKRASVILNGTSIKYTSNGKSEKVK